MCMKKKHQSNISYVKFDKALIFMEKCAFSRITSHKLRYRIPFENTRYSIGINL